MPVPELSESMQKLQQIGQLPGNFEPLKGNIPSHGMHSGAVPTTAITTPLVATPSLGQVSTASKLAPTGGNSMKASPTSQHPNTQQQVSLTSPQYGNISSQIEIHKSFFRQQQSIRKDNKKDTSSSAAPRTPKQSKQQQRKLPMNQEPKKQMFFPEKFPVHPSQLLRQWQGSGSSSGGPTPGQSPTIPGASPTSKVATTPGVIQPSPAMQASVEDPKHPFTSQPELHQLALSAMHSKPSTQQPSGDPPGQQQQQSAALLSPPLGPKPHLLSANSTETPASQQKSAFSMSTILGPKPQPDPMFPPPPSLSGEAGVAKIPGLTQIEHQKEVERKRNLNKLKKKEEKEKVLQEKKKARELEKQKRMEEKAKSKILRDQKKAEKIQEKMLIRQKAMQAKEQAKQIALNKKKKTIQMNKAIQQKAAILQVTEKQKQKPVVPQPIIPPPKPPVPPKIPLCEPDTQLVVPLVQPMGIRDATENSLEFVGKFGTAVFEGFDDVYGEKPLIEELPRLPSETTLINDVPLFASPERMEIGEDEVLGEASDPTSEIIQEEPEIPYELRQVLSCNHCYGPLHDTVYYVDKGFDEVSEGVFDRNDVLLSDQLAFCSNGCIDSYQKKIDYEVDDDVALVDAVKIASMVTLDENHVFPPLPTAGGVRGDACAPGMDPSRLEPDYKKRWTRWQYPFNTEKKSNKTRLMREDLYELMNKYDVRLKLSDDIKDKRVCMLCNLVGDGETAQMSRLLNYDVDQWVHLNCALWSIEVYEALNGGLHNVDKAYARAVSTKCAHCNKAGASINCSHTFGAQQRLHCEKVFHFSCALQAQCSFYKDKVGYTFDLTLIFEHARNEISEKLSAI